MSQPGPEQLAVLARDLVAATTEKGLTVRAIAGVAVYLTCPSIQTHARLQRSFKDLDLVAPPGEFEAIANVLTQAGAARGTVDTKRRLFYKDGAEIELTAPDFRHFHRVDLSSRLALASPTVSVTDLLLIKLQRAKFEEKDIQDSIALLLDHPIGAENEQERINSGYIAQVCARDWGLFRTVYDNTVALEHVSDKYLDGEEAQLVWRRIESIQGDIDKEPKSLGWMLNQVLRRPHQVPA